MWTLAVRVASYGKLGQRASADFDRALRRWDSDAAWQISCEIQIQVSKSKRLLSLPAQQALDKAQKKVVNFLTNEIDRTSQQVTPDDWGKLYDSLLGETRTEIDSLLTEVTKQLKISDSRSGAEH